MLTLIKNWWIARVEAWHIKRGTFDDYRADFIVNKRKTLWAFSGVASGENGFYTDVGVLMSPKPFNRAQVLRYFKKHFPENATILHVDDRNKIITYRVK